MKVVELFLQLEKKDMFTIGVSLLNIITTILLVFVNQYYLKKNREPVQIVSFEQKTGHG